MENDRTSTAPVVLVIDDQDLVQRTFKLVLTGRAIPWVGAKSSDEARKLYAQHRDTLKVICLDGCLDGNGDKFDTLPLAEHFRDTGFGGNVIAMSRDERFNTALCGAGCRYAMPKGCEEIYKLIVELATA